MIIAYPNYRDYFVTRVYRPPHINVCHHLSVLSIAEQVIHNA